MERAGGAEELGVAIGEDPTVRRHQPVAGVAGSGGHADDRPGELRPTGGAVELGVPEGEDPAVGGHEAVAGPGEGRRARPALGTGPREAGQAADEHVVGVVLVVVDQVRGAGTERHQQATHLVAVRAHRVGVVVEPGLAHVHRG